MTSSPFRFFVLNAEDLFVYLDQEPISLEILTELEWQRLSKSIVENKPLRKLFELAKLIELENPDVIVLSEVGGMESLTNFNRLFLKSAYRPFLIEGNSDRGIDIGFMVRETLPVKVHLQSNKDRLLNFLYPHELVSLKQGYKLQYTSHKFSRDIPELHLFAKDSDERILIFLAAHLKSRLDSEGVDPWGRDRREAELQAFVEIFLERSAQYPDIPIFMGGDFNGQAFREKGDTEFSDLFSRTDVVDVMELAGLTREQRSTHVFIDNQGKIIARALDFVFVNQKFAERINRETTGLIHFVDAQGKQIHPPTTSAERALQPSDHRPLRVDLKGLQSPCSYKSSSL